MVWRVHGSWVGLADGLPDTRGDGTGQRASRTQLRAATRLGHAVPVITEEFRRRRGCQDADHDALPPIQFLRATYRHRDDGGARAQGKERTPVTQSTGPVRWPRDGSLHEQAQDGTLGNHGCGGPDVDRHVGAATPHRQDAAGPAQQPLLPATVEGRGSRAHEPDTRLERQGPDDKQRVDPAAMERTDGQVAAIGEMLAAVDPDLKAADPDEECPGRPDEDAVQPRSTPTRRPAQPLEALRGRRGETGRQCLRSLRARAGPIAPPRYGQRNPMSVPVQAGDVHDVTIRLCRHVQRTTNPIDLAA